MCVVKEREVVSLDLSYKYRDAIRVAPIHQNELWDSWYVALFFYIASHCYAKRAHFYGTYLLLYARNNLQRIQKEEEEEKETNSEIIQSLSIRICA